MPLQARQFGTRLSRLDYASTYGENIAGTSILYYMSLMHSVSHRLNILDPDTDLGIGIETRWTMVRHRAIRPPRSSHRLLDPSEHPVQ